MDNITYWIIKIITFGVYETGDKMDSVKIFITGLLIVLFGLVIATIIWLISLIIDHFRERKGNKQFNKNIEHLEKLLIDQANKTQTGAIDVLLNPTPEIKKAYETFSIKDHDYVIYLILDDLQNNNDDNETAVTTNTATTISNTTNTIF